MYSVVFEVAFVCLAGVQLLSFYPSMRQDVHIGLSLLHGFQAGLRSRRKNIPLQFQNFHSDSLT